MTFSKLYALLTFFLVFSLNNSNLFAMTRSGGVYSPYATKNTKITDRPVWSNSEEDYSIDSEDKSTDLDDSDSESEDKEDDVFSEKELFLARKAFDRWVEFVANKKRDREKVSEESLDDESPVLDSLDDKEENVFSERELFLARKAFDRWVEYVANKIRNIKRVSGENLGSPEDYKKLFEESNFAIANLTGAILEGANLHSSSNTSIPINRYKKYCRACLLAGVPISVVLGGIGAVYALYRRKTAEFIQWI